VLDHLPRQPSQRSGQQHKPANFGSGVRAEAEKVRKRISRGHSSDGLPAKGAGLAIHIGDADIQRKGGVGVSH
jgi:hypothetical protein